MKVFKCSEAGYDCNHIIRGHTYAEALMRAVSHVVKEHDLSNLNDAILEKIRAAIEDDT